MWSLKLHESRFYLGAYYLGGVWRDFGGGGGGAPVRITGVSLFNANLPTEGFDCVGGNVVGTADIGLGGKAATGGGGGNTGRRCGGAGAVVVVVVERAGGIGGNNAGGGAAFGIGNGRLVVSAFAAVFKAGGGGGGGSCLVLAATSGGGRCFSGDGKFTPPASTSLISELCVWRRGIGIDVAAFGDIGFKLRRRTSRRFACSCKPAVRMVGDAGMSAGVGSGGGGGGGIETAGLAAISAAARPLAPTG